MSTKRRTLGVYSQKRPLGPNGEKICYNCGGPLPKGRPFNCSSACSEEWQCKTSPSYLRQVIFQRDHGVCALCGTDTEALGKQYRGLPHKDKGRFRLCSCHTRRAAEDPNGGMRTTSFP